MDIRLVNENFQSDYLDNLLRARGIENLSAYYHPTEECLNSPLLLDNIQEGVTLLEQTLQKPDSNILIVVDCDVDGFSSAAIMYTFIKRCAPDQNIAYILHEHKEHGLQDTIEQILNDQVHYDLVILPDSSSNDYVYHEQLKDINTPCLVLDHHDIDANTQISSNTIIINNKMSARYPNKELTGAGVTWQFCRCACAVQAEDLIDLAALGVCGDMGAITNLENRYIMIKGFSHISNYFLSEAVKKQSFSMGSEVTPMGVAFYIVPLMNAMIRTGTMDEKNRLFLGLIDGKQFVESKKRGAKGEMTQVALESLRECTNAKSKQKRLVEQMMELIEIQIAKYDLLENKILFIKIPEECNYPSEINGLCAMQLAEKYKHPTILTRTDINGFDKGSIRNVNHCALTDLKQFLLDSGYFEWVMGHANAAGCCINDKNLRAFHTYANETLNNLNFNDSFYDVNFDRNANSKDLEDLVYDLSRRPDVWGQGNDEARIYIRNIGIRKSDISVMGQNQDTIKFTVNGLVYIKFHAKDFIEDLKNQKDYIVLDVVGRATINEFRGTITPQIQIEAYDIFSNIIDF